MLRRPALFAATALAVAGLAFAQPPATPSKPVAPKKIEPAKAPSKKPAAEVTLKVGSKAPSIKADNWVKGAEVSSFESGKVYVMEFWATWCPPCRESIPHLTKMAKDHKELTIIGMASSERKSKTDDGSDTRLDVLKKFVTEQGEKMNYTVAYDGSRAMGKDWLEAAGQGYIPSAFVVGADGNIAWIGNPLDKGFEPAVEKALKAAAPAKTTSKPDSKSGGESTPAPKPKS